ncbi:MAG: HDOD domain-containing protein [Azonexus sp.]|nr:HDOD domain-containing protein [Azonexus sp.]
MLEAILNHNQNPVAMNSPLPPPTDEPSPDALQKILATVEIPPCPAVVSNAMAAAQKDEPDLAELAKIITADGGMTATMLKLANSSLYGSAAPVSNLRKALDRLGTRLVVCVIVSSALRASMTGIPGAWLEAFWQRSTQLAFAASLIARRQFGVPPDNAYHYALFHDAAIPLMLQRFPDYSELLAQCQQQSALLYHEECRRYPCTHPVVGGLLVKNWGLPKALVQAIRLHHDENVYTLPETTLPGEGLALIAVTHVAEHLLAELHHEPDCDVGPRLFSQAMNYLGMNEDDLDELKACVQEALNQ